MLLRVRALVDEVIEKIVQRSRHRNPNYIQVNGRWVHIDQYAKMMASHRED